jgi:hypothetical protein
MIVKKCLVLAASLMMTAGVIGCSSSSDPQPKGEAPAVTPQDSSQGKGAVQGKKRPAPPPSK